MSTETIFFLICATVVFIMAVYYGKRQKRFASLIFGSFMGIVALVLVNKFGNIIGAELPLNIFNLCGSAVLGVPFVAAMIIVKYL